MPGHQFSIGQPPDAFASLQVTEPQPEGTMTAAVTVSFLDLKGAWQAQLLTGELRLFAMDADQVRRAQAGGARLELLPGVLAFIFYFDRQRGGVCFAVDYCGGLGVHIIPTLAVSPAELAAAVDSLEAADPGELNEARVREIRARAEASRSAAPPPAPQPPPPPQIPAGKVVLTIGQEKITAGAFDRLLDSAPPRTRDRSREQIARDLIRRRVMAQEARRRGLDQDPAFQERLAQTGEQMLGLALRSQLAEHIQPDEAACRAYYNDHPREFDRIQMHEILIRTPGSKWPVRLGQVALTEEQALARAQELRKKLADGADFSLLARDESDEFMFGPGMPLRWRDRPDAGSHFTASAFAQAFDLPLGEVSRPLRDENGYHLIVVKAREQPSFEEARSQVAIRLKNVLLARAEEELQIQAVVVLDEQYFSPPQSDAPGAEVLADFAASGAPTRVRQDPGAPSRVHQPAALQKVRLLHNPSPEYPDEARKTGIQGRVALLILIGTDGSLLEARPSSGDPLLVAAAIKAVSRWVWRPTIQLGVAVEVVTRVDFEFRLAK